MPSAVYLLCMLTSAFCAVLLLREYGRSRARLLLWSSLSFVGWAINNALVFTDLVVLPGVVDLSLFRALVALIAVSLLLYGLLGTISFANEWRVYVFVVRLLAFCLIIYAIVEKNRG